MNIFVTHPSPVVSARYLDNKRKVKMALESTQLLCTALALKGISVPYKVAHPKHPCTIWAGESRENWQWLWEHGMELCSEYKRIYGKTHKCEDVLLQIKHLASELPSSGLTKFANCTTNKENNIDYRHIDNVYYAYQMYLNDRWEHDKREPQWD